MNARARALGPLAVMVCVVLAATFAPMAQAHLGDLDPQFGEGGIVRIPLGTVSCPYPESIQDISFGAAGIFAADYNGLLRLDLSGEINTRFGEPRRASTDCPVGRGVGAVAEQGSRVIALGHSIERLSRNGIPDPSFGRKGTAHFVGEEFADGAIGLDEKIVVAGVDRFVHASPVFERYLPNGRPDRSFGFDGVAHLRTPFEKGASINAVAVQPDGGVIGVGQARGRQGQYEIYVVRLRPDGVRDRRFGGSNNGVVLIPVGYYSLGISVIVAEDRIYVLGTDEGVLDEAHVIVARLLPDGRRDPRFARHGLLVHTVYDMQPTDLALYHGMLVVSGWAGSRGCGDHGACMALARFTRHGEMDRSFGRNGVVRTGVGKEAFGESVAVQVDGDILMGGAANIGDDRVAILARYLGHEGR